MNFFERLKQLTEALFTYRFEVRTLKERQDEDRKEVFELSKEVNRLAGLIQAQGERLARVEAARESDRAQFGAERAAIIAERAELQTQATRFQLEIELAIAKANNARALPQITATENEPNP